MNGPLFEDQFIDFAGTSDSQPYTLSLTLFLLISPVFLLSEQGLTCEGYRGAWGGGLEVGMVADLHGVYTDHITTRLGLIYTLDVISTILLT